MEVVGQIGGQFPLVRLYLWVDKWVTPARTRLTPEKKGEVDGSKWVEQFRGLKKQFRMGLGDRFRVWKLPPLKTATDPYVRN